MQSDAAAGNSSSCQAACQEEGASSSSTAADEKALSLLSRFQALLKGLKFLLSTRKSEVKGRESPTSTEHIKHVIGSNLMHRSPFCCCWLAVIITAGRSSVCPIFSEKLRGCQHHELEETHAYTGPRTGRGTVFLGGCKLFHKFQLPPLRDNMVQLHHHRHSGHEQGNGSEEGLSQTRNLGSMSPNSGASYSHGLTGLLWQKEDAKET